MALLGNYSYILSNPATFIGGTQVSNCRSAFGQSGQNLQMYVAGSVGAGVPKTASLPTGSEPPYSYHLSDKGGEMSSTTMIAGRSEIQSSLANGINILSSLEGSGNISDAGLALITSMVAALAGSGTIVGSMVGTIQMAADLAGSGDIVGSLSMLSGIFANLQGVGIIDSNLKGKLSMASTIYVNQSTAEIEQIVTAVWNALAAQYNIPGTMGEALNGAGTAGNPWTDTGTYGAGTKGKLLQDALKKAQFIALK